MRVLRDPHLLFKQMDRDIEFTIDELELLRDPLSLLEKKINLGEFNGAFTLIKSEYLYKNDETILKIIRNKIFSWFMFSLFLDDDNIKQLENYRKFYDLLINKYG